MPSTASPPASLKMEVADKDDLEIDQLQDDDDDEQITDEDEDDDPSRIYPKTVTPAKVRVQTTEELNCKTSQMCCVCGPVKLTTYCTDAIHEGEIDLSPAYQRDVVWPATKQIGLIDSIYRNFFIPPIIFAVRKQDDGTELRVCVDGKQRLSSIHMFMTGHIPHRNSKNKKTYYWAVPKASGGAKLQLPNKYKEIFRNKPISVVEYHNLTPVEEREIFQRVQLGMSLTAAEKLQAIASPWAEWIAYLEKKHVNGDNDDGLATQLKWNIKRARDFQNIAHMVYCCEGLYRSGEQCLPTAPKLEKWISREDPPIREFKNHVEDVLRSLWVLASDSRYNEAFTKISALVAPVEFVFLGVLLFVLRDEDRHVQARAAYTMRLTIRNEYRDIRNNTVLCKALWQVVDALSRNPNARKLSIDFEPDNQSIAAQNKRKRATGDEDEFRPAPVKGLKNGARATRSKKSKS